MTTKETTKYLSRVGAIRLGKQCQLSVMVKVIDVKTSFGRVDALVTPIAGSGEEWVDVTRIEFVKQQTI